MLFDPILRETATYPHKSFWLSILEVVYITIRYPAFCLALYLTGVHFQGSYSTLVMSVSRKSIVDQSELEK